MTRVFFGAQAANLGGDIATFGDRAVTSQVVYVGAIQLNTVDRAIRLDTVSRDEAVIPLNTLPE